ncbi:MULTISPECIES: MFS transporter [Kribbella]|uniref:NNP family nitrate/nitrite transporter-like MFS transporter n=1 Tax=Kribbella pratensis TaxID=2512112 RepID=A0ABY2FR92_9ACTN|nr:MULTISPECIES: MFS transporter [Kribbella]TDW95660.1 NNP family nitrate/nitrite transporter-like MFS transporter [Kribbella pratensis]TDW98894.1 NNP family nitrate/nitrite transporter-like MFS transporter [Kribbella sp. VKM Ac-2566]
MTLEAGPEVATTRDRTGAVGTVEAPRRGRWIDVWDPEDATFWAEKGRAVARRNLWPSIFAEFLGFSVWQLWSIVVVSMPKAGFTYTTDQLFWLVALPSLVGATLRLPYTFAVPKFGGRNWTIVSASLLLVPTLGLSYFLSRPDTPFWLMVLIAATAGAGGGNFASSMTNISFFYPEKEKGFALGVNAAGGNLGVAVVQLVVPIVIVAGAGLTLNRAGLIWLPLIVLAAFWAWKSMANLSAATSSFRASVAAAKRPQTWIISFLYIGTFGSFIGFSAAFPLLIKTTFPDITVAHIAFLGALVGSVSRPFGGKLADRVGGAWVTVCCFVVMGLGILASVVALKADSFAGFLISFLFLFVASGAANGSVYRMIPAVFRLTTPGDPGRARREAAACIGIASAVGAYGGFLVPRGFAMSTSHFGSLIPALYVFCGFYVICLAVTYFCYLRKGGSLSREHV